MKFTVRLRLPAASRSCGDAKARFSEIVDRAVNGEEFVVTRMGRAAVRISRLERRARSRKLGDLAGQVWIADDFEEWPPYLRDTLGLDVPEET